MSETEMWYLRFRGDFIVGAMPGRIWVTEYPTMAAHWPSKEAALKWAGQNNAFCFEAVKIP